MTTDALVRIYRRNSKLNAYRRGDAPAFVDTQPVWAHVDRLIAEGWGSSLIALAAGCAPSLVRDRNPRMRPALASRLLRVTRAELYTVAPGESLVPNIGAIRRIRSLQVLGWPLPDIAGTIARNAVGRNGKGVISARSWRLIRDRYDALAMDEGPSERVRGWAAYMGWPPPLAWDDDDLDNPHATPQGAA